MEKKGHKKEGCVFRGGRVVAGMNKNRQGYKDTEVGKKGERQESTKQ